MGEPEQVIAEPDEVEEGVEGLHPPTLDQQNPKVISDLIYGVRSFIGGNGWYILGVLLTSYIAWTYIEPMIKKWLQKKEEEREASYYHKNPDIVLARHHAIDVARQKMQEEYNKAAAVMKEKEKIKKEKNAELERKHTGRGYTLKSKGSDSASVSVNNGSNAKAKQATKPKLRPEYNPLTGDTGASSSCRWRPSDRGASGGG